MTLRELLIAYSKGEATLEEVAEQAVEAKPIPTADEVNTELVEADEAREDDNSFAVLTEAKDRGLISSEDFDQLVAVIDGVKGQEAGEEAEMPTIKDRPKLRPEAVEEATLTKKVAPDAQKFDSIDEDVAVAAGADAVGEDAHGEFEWQGPLVVEGIPTGDRRQIAPGGLAYRDMPLPLMFSRHNDEGHKGSEPAGRIARIERRDDGVIYGFGYFDSGEVGQEARRMLKEGTLRGVSIDMDMLEIDEASAESYMLEGGTLLIKTARIMGATVTPFPAYAEAYLEIIEQDEALVAAGASAPVRATWHSLAVAASEDSWGHTLETIDGALVASGPAQSRFPMRPDPSVFLPPTSYEPFAVSDDGVISGHVTTWKAEHIGFTGRKIKAPRSKTEYAMMHTPGTMICSDGSTVNVARLFADTVHPDLALKASDTAAHYHDTGACLGFVRVYDTEWGIAVAGTMNPAATELDAIRLRASDVSPDWRPMSVGLEMVALLAVNWFGSEPWTRCFWWTLPGQLRHDGRGRLDDRHPRW